MEENLPWGSSCLEEVVWRSSADHGLAGSWTRVELQARNHLSVFCQICKECEDTYKVYFKCSSISMMAA
jgi:hypothetical protein